MSITAREISADEILNKMTNVIRELAARWMRADGDDHFTAGRKAGYVQAISLMLNVYYADTLKMLQEGQIK